MYCRFTGEARRIVASLSKHYTRAIAQRHRLIAPADKLAGRELEIFAPRSQVEAARQTRQPTRALSASVAGLRQLIVRQA